MGADFYIPNEATWLGHNDWFMQQVEKGVCTPAEMDNRFKKVEMPVISGNPELNY